MREASRTRRQTALAARLADRIRRQGPITVSDYMTACLGDEELGYYRTREGIGAEGDFITAPEISQVFGELIGLWCVVVWQQMGAPTPLRLIELGPGRGTLMTDALRAAGLVKGFGAATRVHLVEINGALRARQRETLQGLEPRVSWHDDIAEVPDGPAIVIANEFLDVASVAQWVAVDGRWRARVVTLDDDGDLQFAVGKDEPEAALAVSADSVEAGAIFEVQAVSPVWAALGERGRRAPVAGLFIDYGHWGPLAGDTLQAVRRQAYEHPLTSPGEADLTVQVDFAAAAAAAEAGGLRVASLTTQAEWLGRLGITQRASRLMAANPARAAAIEAGVARLMAPGGMGGRFKVMGVRSPGLGELPGLEVQDGGRMA